MTNSKEHTQGFFAKMDDYKPREANPFPPDSKEHAEWDEGWLSAENVEATAMMEAREYGS
jgi:hypothetical protein